MNVVDDTKAKMKQAIAHLKEEYKALRTGRVSPNMLDDVKVEVYGSQMPLKSLGTVSVQDRQLIITPFDPSTSAAITKAIMASAMKLNAISESGHIRVPIPPLNEQTRKDIAKQAKQKSENAKVVIREIRRKGNETVRKQKADGDITEDDLKKAEKKIQDFTDEHCNELDKIFVEKEKEIMTV